MIPFDAARQNGGFVRKVLPLCAVFAVAGLAKLTGRAQADAPSSAGASAPLTAFEQKIPGTDVRFKMVPIPGGQFTMGSPDSEKGRKEDEGPQHEIQVDAFFMGEHSVTWDEYNYFLENYQRLSEKKPVPIPPERMVDAVTYPTPIYDVDAAPKLQRMGGRRGKFPAVIVSQFAARQYTKWLSKKTGRFYRIPSEAEWEYAARAGTKTAYFFGDDPSKLGDYAWIASNSNEPDGDVGYHEVMTKKPNPWGLYDMYGNVAQWCVDQYAADWYKQFAGKTTKWVDAINWPSKQYPRVLRGGSFASDPEECRSAARAASSRQLNVTDPQAPKSPHWLSDGFFVGFRIVSPVKEPSEPEKLKWWNADDPITAETIRQDKERYQLIEPPPHPIDEQPIK